MKLSMEDAIDRALKKFNLEKARPMKYPMERTIKITEGEKNDKFPIKSIVGSLQYIATM